MKIISIVILMVICIGNMFAQRDEYDFIPEPRTAEIVQLLHYGMQLEAMYDALHSVLRDLSVNVQQIERDVQQLRLDNRTENNRSIQELIRLYDIYRNRQYSHIQNIDRVLTIRNMAVDGYMYNLNELIRGNVFNEIAEETIYENGIIKFDTIMHNREVFTMVSDVSKGSNIDDNGLRASLYRKIQEVTTVIRLLNDEIQNDRHGIDNMHSNGLERRGILQGQIRFSNEIMRKMVYITRL